MSGTMYISYKCTPELERYGTCIKQQYDSLHTRNSKHVWKCMYLRNEFVYVDVRQLGYIHKIYRIFKCGTINNGTM